MPETVPLTEDCPLSALNPYGRTKLFQEDMFRDLSKSDPTWRIILLRYFNPVGAHPSGEIGEHPVGVPNNLMPYVHQVQELVFSCKFEKDFYLTFAAIWKNVLLLLLLEKFRLKSEWSKSIYYQSIYLQHTVVDLLLQIQKHEVVIFLHNACHDRD